MGLILRRKVMYTPRQRGKFANGFTILEILLAIGIFAIMSQIAWENLARTNQDYQLRFDVRNIQTFLEQARADAIRFRESVTCGIDQGTISCTNRGNTISTMTTERSISSDGGGDLSFNGFGFLTPCPNDGQRSLIVKNRRNQMSVVVNCNGFASIENS